MKYAIYFLLGMAFTLIYQEAFSATKCEASPRGMCCWDTNTDGPFKPVSCY